MTIALAAIGAGALFSTLVQSLRDLSRSTVEEIVAIRNRPSLRARVERILDDVDGHANAVSLPRVACNLITAVALVFWISHVRAGLETPSSKAFAEAAAAAPSSPVAPTWMDALVGVFACSFLLWVFGFLVPSSIARHAGEVAVVSWSRLIRAAYLATGPAKQLGAFLDEVVRRLAGRHQKAEGEQIQDELLSVVEEAEEEGQFDRAEKEMIEAVVRFRNLKVGQIMTPRTEIQALEMTDNLGDLTKYIRRVGHSRVPVYEDNLDHVVGMFYVKDLLLWLAGDKQRGSKPFSLKAILRPALFVPETKTVRELMAELLAKRVHLAIVADEFGGTAGLVTIEDIMEQIVGEIQDEYEQPESGLPEVQLDTLARAAVVDARAYITDVNSDLAALELEIPESESYETVGGFVTVTMGRIPHVGESFEQGQMRVLVLEAEPTRVTRVRLEARSRTESREGEPRSDAAAEASPETSPIETR
ncbi:MAG: hemolysin family protein [Planctomycetota bacterium]|nr:hemolysin family protein [Planctomycetota bacterium]